MKRVDIFALSFQVLKRGAYCKMLLVVAKERKLEIIERIFFPSDIDVTNDVFMDQGTRKI